MSESVEDSSCTNADVQRVAIGVGGVGGLLTILVVLMMHLALFFLEYIVDHL